jgi:hypothetical protein
MTPASSPRAAGLTGLLFAVLFSVSVVILKVSVSDVSTDSGQWLADKSGWVKLAIGLMAFAGIFFLWFIGVVRARLGRLEDQFFSAVFLGSGLLFLAMVFVGTGVAGAIVTGYQRDPTGFPNSPTYWLARDIITQIFSIYALRMAAVFLLSQATLWLRTKVMPRWMAVITYPLALLLLFVFTESFWVVLVFPAWVLLVSVHILIVSFRHRPDAGDTAAQTAAAAASKLTDGRR